jgi:hypothetical protein
MLHFRSRSENLRDDNLAVRIALGDMGGHEEKVCCSAMRCEQEGAQRWGRMERKCETCIEPHGPSHGLKRMPLRCDAGQAEKWDMGQDLDTYG